MCKWTQEYEKYILLRGFEVISFFGQDSNWFLYPMHFFAFFSDFLWKNVANVHKWLHICTKIDSSIFFAHKLYYSHPRDTFYNTLRQFMHFYNCCQIICSRDSHQNLKIYFFSCVHCKIHRSFLKFCNQVNIVDMKSCRILL